MRERASQSSLNNSVVQPQRRQASSDPAKDENYKELEKQKEALEKELHNAQQRHLNEVQILKEQI